MNRRGRICRMTNNTTRQEMRLLVCSFLLNVIRPGDQGGGGSNYDLPLTKVGDRKGRVYYESEVT